ncbi:exosporium leader peptide-containing protein [Bacillus wiedmannii]|uniref:exosporium leader peptide-containing protein n=1 Tax=Bacillus wiedmannii TaxID=1890302 RepID=UPI00352AB4FB
MDEFLSSPALNPDSIGPTLPPVPPFQLPTGPTGVTGAKGNTGLLELEQRDLLGLEVP